MSRLNFLDLFSGIGGFAYASQLAGLEFDHHFYSEIEPYACKVYKKNFPNAIGLGNIKKIDCEKLKAEHGDRWFITGGFPCQNISEAGQRAGINGDRSRLWYEMLRVISELRPKAAIIENVPALAYRGLERVLFSLAEIGYSAEWRFISAKSVGAPHWRKRIWVITYPNGDRCDPIASQECSQQSDVGDNDQPSNSHDWQTSWADWQTVIAQGTICDEPLVCRMDDGLSPWLDRLKGLGNAIVPQVAAQVIRRVVAAGLLEQVCPPE